MGEDCATHDDHARLKKWVSSRSAKERRRYYRQVLHDTPHAAELFDGLERPRFDDTSSEPDVIP